MNEGKSVTRVDTAIPPDDPSKPESPPDLRRRVWMVSLKRAALAAPDKWRCPNCGEEQQRPPLPGLEHPSSPITI